MQESDKIRIVIAEDEALIRDGLKRKIEEIDPDFDVTALAADGAQALEAVDRTDPQILFTDIKMPGMDGIELIRRLKLGHPSIHAVVLSGYADFTYTQQAIRYGVFNYLLKPVEEEALRDTLHDLKQEIRAEQHRRSRTVIYSANYTSRHPFHVRYGLFALCIGNLCHDSTDKVLSAHFSNLCGGIGWHSVLKDIFPEAADWYLADEDDPNQKLLCFSVGDAVPFSGAALALSLRRRLQALLPGTPITVCTCEATVPESDIWLCAQRLRNILRQRVVPGRGAVLLLERDELLPENELLEIVKMRVNDQLRGMIDRRMGEELRSELQLLFQFMQDNALTQQDWQRVTGYILRMLEFSGCPLSPGMQADVLRRISLAPEGRVAADLTQAVLRCIPGQEEKLPDDPDSLAQKLAEYLDRNFIALENLEDITAAFPYNYAYLARLFKRTIGISMGRYVLAKRMELAQQLICNNENLSMAEIAEMSGYHDSRYFARSFKTFFGMTPTEYRASKIPQG